MRKLQRYDIVIPLLFAIGAVLLIYLPRDLWRLSWPTTTATIQTSQRVWHVTTPSNGKGYPLADVVYAYAVNGTNYTCDNYDAEGPYGDPFFHGEERVADVLGRFPVGSTHTVYYKSGDPSFAVLSPTMSWREWTIYPIAYFLMGIVFRINWLRWKAKRRPVIARLVEPEGSD